MLKITIHSEAQLMRIELEGRLTGPWVRELDRCWKAVAAAPHGEILVNLSEVPFIDDDGKMLLSRMWREGARLHAVGCLTKCIVEEITKEG
ncbi:MAG: hypothetical protein R3B74_14245 [Nitrospirales bacterium]|nr:hypothetical protein [Nitrospirales bacterium]